MAEKKQSRKRIRRPSGSSSSAIKNSMVYEIELELSKLKREKSVIVLNKAIFMYFFFIFLAVVSLLTGFTNFFNILVILGLSSIIIGSIPYVRTMYTEEEKLKDMIEKLRNL